MNLITLRQYKDIPVLDRPRIAHAGGLPDGREILVVTSDWKTIATDGSGHNSTWYNGPETEVQILAEEQ